MTAFRGVINSIQFLIPVTQSYPQQLLVVEDNENVRHLGYLYVL